jgi:putative nucleotidyltransferase with HDIG domain
VDTLHPVDAAHTSDAPRRGGWSIMTLAQPGVCKTAYLAVIIASGILVVLASARDLSATHYGLRWLVLAGLTIVGGFAQLRLPNMPASFSISDSFTIAAALLFGPAAGALAVVIDSLAISFQLATRTFGIRRLLFNATAPALAMWVAAHGFFVLAGVGPLAESETPLAHLLGPLMVFAGLYFVLNTGLIAGAIAFERRMALFGIWRRHFLSLWLTYFGGAIVAALLIALVNSRTDDLLVFALIAPIPLILYAAFKNAVGRMEDQFAHLGQVNRMYLATIEALATAIEAKDGVTHDHIRRVQRYAVGLAQTLGVTDENTIRAIEAAALLHDTGKLAVPEHILNKPGKLTPCEFEKMKRHVNVGADILAAIDFPYPIVPIVRCHHEAWDGSGYPQGLQGTDIPIGARILSVVDCFDALTSDRPYRLALSEEAAIEILMAGRGTRYDPQVADTFVRIYRELRLQPDAAPVHEDLYAPISRAAEPPSSSTVAAADLASESVNEWLGLASLARLASDRATPDDLMLLAATLLHQLVPGATCSFYRANTEDELVLCHAAGPLAPALKGFTMGVNQGLSGWVAAHRQTIVNSDAALDLVALGLPPASRMCMSTPLLDHGTLVGVLTLYTELSVSITEDQLRIVQTIAPVVANILTRIDGARVMTAPATLTVQSASDRPDCRISKPLEHATS